ncbi:MAG: hypothetical protein EOP48_23925, partial [Sphingobacteriales bacterium]
MDGLKFLGPFSMNMLATTKTDLAADYYLTNFHFLLNWVEQRYRDLLSPDEQQFLGHFKQLKRSSQCLLVRLVSRKGPLFRRDKLQYAEIDSIEEAANELMQVGLLKSECRLDLKSIASLLTKTELITIFEGYLQGIKHLRK